MATLTKEQAKSLNESIAAINKSVDALAKQRNVSLPSLTPVKAGTPLPSTKSPKDGVAYNPRVSTSGGGSVPYLSGASSGLTPEQLENERIAQEKRFGVSIPKQQPIEPTVVTDANVRETYKPKLDERINKLSETGQYFDGAGNKRNSDGTIVDERTEDRQVSYLEQDAEDNDMEMFRVLDQMRKQTDADTARQVSAIEAQYGVRKQQVAEANRRAEQATSTALLLGGSSRYTTSGDDILAAEVRGGIMELAQIDAMEQGAIAEIKSAQAEKNYRLASQKLEILESRRKEKLDKASQIAERIAKENEIMRQNMIRSSREQAVAGLFMQGITDAATIQAMLAFDEQGMPTGSDITLDEITKTLAIINPPEDMTGLSADYRTYKAMQESGEIPADWSLFDYQRAVKNATTKATGGGGAVSAPSAVVNGQEIQYSYNWSGAKANDLKNAIRQYFSSEFATQLILELTDEQLREFMLDFETAQEIEQMSIDPVGFFEEWKKTFNIKQPKASGGGSLDSKIDSLFGE